MIGRPLGLPIELQEREHFGWFANFAGADMFASSERTRALLGWKPTGRPAHRSRPNQLLRRMTTRRHPVQHHWTPMRRVKVTVSVHVLVPVRLAI